jgi:Uma2 family endonuclease
MTAVAKQKLTPEEYLKIERAAERKSEFYNGEMFAMTGVSRQHVRIVVNLTLAIGNQLRSRPCEIFVNDMRVKVSPTGLYTYPDVVGLCEEPRFEDEQLDTLVNPALIIEVLSPSTEAYDRGKKFAHFQNVATLQEYVLVAQEEKRVEKFARQADGTWIFSAVSGDAGVMRLQSIGCELPLAELYQRVEFPVEQSKPAAPAAS